MLTAERNYKSGNGYDKHLRSKTELVAQSLISNVYHNHYHSHCHTHYLKVRTMTRVTRKMYKWGWEQN